MFARFESHFRQDAALSRPTGSSSTVYLVDHSIKELLLRFGGVSFNNGMYRIMAADTLEAGKEFIAHAFPDFAGRSRAFACDWLGRVFALDQARREGGLPTVLMFEPGTGQSLEIPCNLLTFHENELIHHSDEALAALGFPPPVRSRTIVWNCWCEADAALFSDWLGEEHYGR